MEKLADGEFTIDEQGAFTNEHIIIDGKRIVLSFCETGLVFATSPDVKGLLVAKCTKEETLAAVPGVIADLGRARDWWEAMTPEEQGAWLARKDMLDELQKRAWHGITDWSKIDALTDEEIAAAVADDPDAAPIDLDWSEAEVVIPAAPDRALATVRMILDIRPIPNADAIEVATVDGWDVVVKRGEFKVGDLAVYYECDSFLPERPEYEFLRANSYRTNWDGTKGFRLKTIRLRGQLSQGLLLPLDALSDLPDGKYAQGDDLTALLGVTKWEKPIPACLRGSVKSTFPTHIVPKTDEPRIQNLSRQWPAMRQATRWFVREKLDGTSLTFFHNKGEFGVCSRNQWLKETEDNAYWQIVRRECLEDRLGTFCAAMDCNIALQGELCGPGIQGNHYKLAEPTLFLFSIYDIDAQKYSSDSDLETISASLGLKAAPLYNIFANLPATIAEILEYSNKKSLVCPDVDAEGCVWRCYDVYGARQHSFKAISNAFLLKQKD